MLILVNINITTCCDVFGYHGCPWCAGVPLCTGDLASLSTSINRFQMSPRLQGIPYIEIVINRFRMCPTAPGASIFFSKGHIMMNTHHYRSALPDWWCFCCLMLLTTGRISSSIRWAQRRIWAKRYFWDSFLIWGPMACYGSNYEIWTKSSVPKNHRSLVRFRDILCLDHRTDGSGTAVQCLWCLDRTGKFRIYFLPMGAHKFVAHVSLCHSVNFRSTCPEIFETGRFLSVETIYYVIKNLTLWASCKSRYAGARDHWLSLNQFAKESRSQNSE